MIKRKFEDDSIKYPVDVQKSTMKAKVDKDKKHEDSAYYRQDIPEQPIDDTPFIRIIANTNILRLENMDPCGKRLFYLYENVDR